MNWKKKKQNLQNPLTFVYPSSLGVSHRVYVAGEQEAEKSTAASKTIQERTKKVKVSKVSRQARPAGAPARAGRWRRLRLLHVAISLFKWGTIILLCIVLAKRWVEVPSTHGRCVRVQCLIMYSYNKYWTRQL